MAKEAHVALPRNFRRTCGEFCERDTTVTTQYFADPDSVGDILEETFPFSSPSIISGVLDVQLTGHSGGFEICPHKLCNITVQIPVKTQDYDKSKSMLCMRIEDGKAMGGCETSGICLVSYDKTSGMATCETNMLGEMFILQYDSTSLQALGEHESEENDREEQVSQVLRLIYCSSSLSTALKCTSQKFFLSKYK